MANMAALIAVGFLAIGFTAAYAQQFDPIPFVPETTECNFFEDLTTMMWSCKATAPKDFGIRVTQDLGNDTLAINTLKGIQEAKANGTYVMPPIQGLASNDETSDKPRTTLDWYREQACKRDEPSMVQLCSDLNQLSYCEQAVTESESEPASTYRKFVVSVGETADEPFNLHNNTFLRKVLKAKEDCRAVWEQLQPNVLGAQYLDFVRQINDTQPYHADMASTMVGHPASGFLAGAINRTQTEAQLVLCAYDGYDATFKEQQGCPIHTDYLVIKNPSGMVDHSTAPLDKWLKYIHDPKAYPPDVPSQFVVIKECGKIVDGELSSECDIAIKVNK